MICEFVQIFSGFILQIVLYLCLFRIIWVTLRQFYSTVQDRRNPTRRLGQTELQADDDNLPRVFLDDSGDHEDLVVNQDALNDDDEDGRWEDGDDDFDDARALDQTFDGRLNQTIDVNDSKGGGGRLNQTFEANDSRGGGGRLNKTFDGNDSKGGGGRLNQTFETNDSKGGEGHWNQTCDLDNTLGSEGLMNQTCDLDGSKGGEGVLNRTIDADDSKAWEDIDGEDDGLEEGEEEEEEKIDISPFPPKATWRVYQDFDKILVDCLEKNILFEDPEFPANADAIAFSEERKQRLGILNQITWERPPKITDSPEFFGDRPTRFNMILDDWIQDFGLVSAIASMTLHPDLIFKVAPPRQCFSNYYAGIFMFVFWHFGEWITVVVDDRLPCYNKELIFGHSKDGKEFWFPLLEKAYAKLHGAYEAIEKVDVSEALVDLTGGIAELYQITDYRDNDIFNILTRSNEMESLISSSIPDDPNPQLRNKANYYGLYPGMPYSVTNITTMLVNRPAEGNREGAVYMEQMVRLRNPWGLGIEWRGEWRDGAKQWAWVSEEEKETLEIKDLQDGEWWMSYHDFIQHFRTIEIVSLTPSSVENSKKIPWESHFLHGEWVAGVSAGGMAYMHKNPQYRISLTAVDEHQGDGKCVASISIMQKYRRSMLKLGKTLAAIGFELYHLKADYLRIFPLPERFFLENNYPLVHCPPMSARNVTLTVRIPPGTYLIVPFTLAHSVEAEFLIRVCASSFMKLSANDRQLRIKAKQDLLEPDELFYQYADQFDANGEEEISWKNLKVILDYFGSSIPHFKGFSKETVRSAIALADGNMNGRIDKNEFDQLCTLLQHYKEMFVNFDKNNTGHLPPFALPIVLEDVGIECNDKLVGSMMHRFGKEDGSISFDDYILCLIKVTGLIAKFKNQTTENSKWARFRLDHWLQANIFT